MNPLEKQAHDADALRTWAGQNDSPLLEQMADGLDRDLSRTLTAEYEARRGTYRAPEGDHELTREQEQTLACLATDFDSVGPSRFLPSGAVLADCFNWNELDGSPELVNVVHIEPGGIPL